ncbi:MAG: hypothetical protein Q9194_006151 [Teloschistes cf. exilis]
MIKIFVNNRLGIKKEIPCSPTDTIEEFKKIAAMYMGMRSESFMLKKQEQRPMKDFLTLEDYEIGNGASLDLEVDTGEQGRKIDVSLEAEWPNDVDADLTGKCETRRLGWLCCPPATPAMVDFGDPAHDQENARVGLLDSHPILSLPPSESSA